MSTYPYLCPQRLGFLPKPFYIATHVANKQLDRV
jgi:hypothetical protein